MPDPIVATWDEMRNATPGQDMGSFPKNVARAAKDVLCAVNAITPEWMTQGGVGGIIGSPMVRDLCRRVPPQNPGSRQVPFQGGQCPVVYEFRGTVTAVQANGNVVTSSDSGFRSRTIGPLTGKFIDYIGPNVGGNMTIAVGYTAVNGGRAVVANIAGATYQGDTLEFRRVDLAPDTCGNPSPPPVAVPPVGDIMRPVPIPTPGGPVIVPVVIPVGVLFKPTLQVNVGDINVNFNAGGVTFSPTVNVNPAPRPSGEPQPSSPPAPPLPPSRPPAKDEDEGGDCPDPCPPSVEFVDITVQVTVCKEVEKGFKPERQDKTVKVIKGTEELVKEQYRQLLPLTWDECNSRNIETQETPVLLQAGTVGEGNRIVTIGIPGACQQVFLKILEPIPPTVNLYAYDAEGPPNGKFGTIQLRSRNFRGIGGAWVEATAGYIWTTQTFYDCPGNESYSKVIRLTLRPGINYELYDSGIRKPIKEPI